MIHTRAKRIAMVSYSEYFADARIKNYVDALLKIGIAVDVYALGRERGVYRQAGLSVHSLGGKYQGSNVARYVASQFQFILRAIWGLMIGSLHKRYDIIHAHNMPNLIVTAGLPFKLMGTKLILDIHDTMPEAYATKFGYELESLLIKALIREELFSAACADKVIATNRMHKEVLILHGVRADKIELIYNVGNTKIFKPLPPAPKSGDLWLGYHGTIAMRLGIFLIVDALAILRDRCPNLRFLCIGEGDDLISMKSHAIENKVMDMIEWGPFVNVEELPDRLRRVRVGIIGNLRKTEEKRNYMLPVKMLEYAAMEIPSIVPRLKIFKRYFYDDSSFFYEPDDVNDLSRTICSIYEDQSLISSKLIGLRKFNSEYNWDIMAKRYLNIIQELTGQ